MKKNIFKAIININNFFIFHFNKINEFLKFINQKFKNISSFNKYLIFVITILFVYLFYLSIPSLYDKGKIQTKLNKMINKTYNINLSLSSELTYNILPKPHILISNAKFFTNNLDAPKELGQIKKIRIFISQKNFFNKEKIKINYISIDQANFSFKKKDLFLINEYLNTKFSKKKLSIKNSKFFYLNSNDEVVSIFPIKKLTLFFDEKKKLNILESKGRFFTIPYIFNWTKNFEKNFNFSSLKIQELNTKIENFSKAKDSVKTIENIISFRNIQIETDINIKDNLIEINSKNVSKTKNDSLNYDGYIELKPFNSKFNINLKKLNFQKNIIKNNLLINIFEKEAIYNKNLTSTINLNIDKLNKSRLFDSSQIKINIKNGDIDFDKSFFNGTVGSLKLINSRINNFKDDLVFNGDFIFTISSKDIFYKLFQVGKKDRKNIENIYFNLEFNLTKNNFKIDNLTFDPGQIKNEEELDEFLKNYSNDSKEINWIDFKNFTKKIFLDYFEG